MDNRVSYTWPYCSILAYHVAAILGVSLSRSSPAEKAQVRDLQVRFIDEPARSMTS